MRYIIFSMILFLSACTTSTNSHTSTELPEKTTPQPIMLRCTQCGREFEKDNGYQLNNLPGYFCSKSCAKDYVYEHGGFTTDY